MRNSVKVNLDYRSEANPNQVISRRALHSVWLALLFWHYKANPCESREWTWRDSNPHLKL